MLTKKTALIPALIAMSVAATSLAVFAGPSGHGHGGHHHGGGDGKNGNDNGDGGKNGGDGGGKNGGEDTGGGGGGGGQVGNAGEGKRCSAYRNTPLNRHCRDFERRHTRLYTRARMVPCMQGDAIVYDYDCGRRIVYVPRQAPVYYVQGPATYDRDEVVVRKSYRRLAKRQRLVRRRVVMADAGGYGDYGYDGGAGYEYAGMSRAARMQQERRMRRQMAMQYDYDYGYAGGYGGGGYGYDDGHGYGQPRPRLRKKMRRRVMPIDYGYGYDIGTTIHYGPTVLKNGAY